MKIVFVEPNLKTMSGHVFEAMKALVKYFQNHTTNEIKIGYVGHQRVDEKVLDFFPTLSPLYKLSCFEEGDINETVSSIEDIVKYFGLGNKDLIVFTTAHLRDIEAVTMITKGNNMPRFIMQIHQYYPPLVDADMIFDPEVNLKLKSRYKQIFKSIDKRKVFIVTTPVKALAERIYDITGYKPKRFPVPFAPILGLNKLKNNILKIGFFGDGRKEKGLLDFLRFIENQTRNPDNKYGFVVQVQNPRGFSKDECGEINFLLDQLKDREFVEIIKGSLSTDNYYRQLNSCDLVCILHDPRHYSIRLSGIAVECGMMEIPVTAKKGTSVSDWISSGKLFGELIVGDKMLESIDKIKKMVDDPEVIGKIQSLSVIWKQEYSAKNYINNYLLPLIKHEWK